MCELCTGEFNHTLTLEVGRAALMRQTVDDFGPLHAVVENCNVDDDNINRALADPESSPVERQLCELLLAMSYDDRVSALALAANHYGAQAIRYRD